MSSESTEEVQSPPDQKKSFKKAISQGYLWRSRLYFALLVLRTILIAVLFLVGAILICLSQLIFNLVFQSRFNVRHGLIAVTKRYFVVLTSAIFYFITPAKIRVTADLSSMPKGTFTLRQGELISGLLPKLMIIANHQIYTDWAFLWWVCYTANLGDFVYIMLKESLRKIPLLGYGMSNYRFIFLSRKWERDQQIINSSMRRLEILDQGTTDDFIDGISPASTASVRAKWPYSLILFPEGTNMSPSRREASDRYCEKLGIPKLRHVLLPRTTGMRCCLRGLRKSCDTVYDVTIGYSGINRDQYGEAIYTLGSVFVEGKAPAITDMHFRALQLKDVPLGPDIMTPEEDEKWAKEFENWLFKVWREKDDLMETYYTHGTFTPGLDLSSSGYNLNDKFEVAMAPLKPKSLWELVQIFAVPLTVMMVLRLILIMVWTWF